MTFSEKHCALIHERKANEARAQACLDNLCRVVRTFKCDERVSMCSSCPLSFDGYCIRDVILLAKEKPDERH